MSKRNPTAVGGIDKGGGTRGAAAPTPTPDLSTQPPDLSPTQEPKAKCPRTQTESPTPTQVGVRTRSRRHQQTIEQTQETPSPSTTETQYENESTEIDETSSSDSASELDPDTVQAPTYVTETSAQELQHQEEETDTSTASPITGRVEQTHSTQDMHSSPPSPDTLSTQPPETPTSDSTMFEREEPKHTTSTTTLPRQSRVVRPKHLTGRKHEQGDTTSESESDSPDSSAPATPKKSSADSSPEKHTHTTKINTHTNHTHTDHAQTNTGTKTTPRKTPNFIGGKHFTEAIQWMTSPEPSRGRPPNIIHVTEQDYTTPNKQVLSICQTCQGAQKRWPLVNGRWAMNTGPANSGTRCYSTQDAFKHYTEKHTKSLNINHIGSVVGKLLEQGTPFSVELATQLYVFTRDKSTSASKLISKNVIVESFNLRNKHTRTDKRKPANPEPVQPRIEDLEQKQYLHYQDLKQWSIDESILDYITLDQAFSFDLLTTAPNKGARPMFLEFQQRILQQLNSFPRNTAAQVAMHSFPALVLSKGPKASVVKERMLLFFKGKYTALLADASIIKRKSGPQQDDQRIRRAKAKMNKGQTSDAMKILQSEAKPLRHTASNITKAKEKLQGEIEGGKPIPKSSTFKHIDPNNKVTVQEVKNICKMAKEKSPGGDCMPTETFKYANDKYCATIADFINLFITGAFPKDYCSRLTGGKLIILSKPSGGIRPIVVQSALYRLVTKVLSKRATHELRAQLQPYQFGLESNNLIPIAVNSLLQTNPTHTLMSVDVENAYGSIDRNTMYNTAITSPSEWLPNFILAAFSQPTVIFHKEGKISTTRGVLQGDAMSMVLFTMTIHPAIKHTADKFPQIQPLSFADDINLVGETQDLKNAYEHLRDQLLKVGCRCNPNKTQLLERSNNQDLTKKLAQDLGAEHTRTVTVLGVPITGEPQQHASEYIPWFQQFVKACAMVEAYSKEDSQGAMHMLTQSVQAKPAFIMETSDTQSTKQLAQQIDEELLRLLYEIAGGDTDYQKLNPERRTEILAKARMPVDRGGVGLRPWSDQRIVAYLSNYVKASHNAQVFSNAVYECIKKYALKQHGPVNMAVQAMKQIKAFTNLSQANGKAVSIPRNQAQVIGEDHDHPNDNLPLDWRQKITDHLFQSYYIQYKQKYCSDSTNEEALHKHAKLLEQNLMAAGKWINASRSVALFRFKTEDYAYALRQRLGMKLQVKGIKSTSQVSVWSPDLRTPSSLLRETFAIHRKT
eukprot:m.349887 g.349887  ORF g.349887 m.349887 type:complete len:1245 (-) comp16155_c1_seq6:884-4618(-)